MPVNDDLGRRMKENYEKIPRNSLVRRMPVALRLDGKAFHTFTKGLQKPYDTILMDCMAETTKYLCENIQGCVFGYTQSDEITLILIDYQNLETDAWFNYEVQKMCSIAASMATFCFNKIFSAKVEARADIFDAVDAKFDNYMYSLFKAVNKGALFDCRCFNIPKEEVANLIYWRQLDAMRNSVQMLGQARYSHKELQGLSCNKIKEKLREDGDAWEDYMPYVQRGTAVIKEDKHWTIKRDMPVIKNENRKYVNDCILYKEGE